MPNVILDQNALRNTLLDQYLSQAVEGDLFVLSEPAFVELFKGNEYELISKNSFIYIKQHPEYIAVAFSISHLMQQEITTRQLTKDIISEILTNTFRLILKEFRDCECPGPHRSALMKSVAEHQPSLATSQLNINNKRPHLEKLKKHWEDNLSQDDLKSLRNGEWTAEQWRNKSGIAAANDTIKILMEEGWPREEAVAFCKQSPLLFRFQVAFHNLALKWLEKGGLETATPGKVMNDLMDMDYAVTATYAADLITFDNKAREQFLLLKRVLAIDTVST